MKKKNSPVVILLVVLILILVIGLVLFFVIYGLKREKPVTDVVRVTIAEYQPGKILNYRVENHSKKQVIFDPDRVWIEEQKNGTWEQVQEKQSLVLLDMGIIVDPESEKEWVYDANVRYGVLGSGKYRFVINTFRYLDEPHENQVTIYAEFEIP